MPSATILSHSGGKITIAADAIDQLAASLRGERLLPGEAQYDQARTIWNAMIDRRPGLIIMCAGVADVQAAVKFAAKHNLLTAIHGGGHNIAGNAVCDDGLMINLSRMNNVQVDPFGRKVHVGPGAKLGDVDHETQAFGLAVPVGINSTTGIAGLTLGGGFGWISRKYGLTVDALRSVDMVKADGEFVHASAQHNPDLFWAVRGGGGNFGVVTRFEYECYPVGPGVLSGLIVFPHAEAVSVLKKYREFMAQADENTCVWTVMRQAPPLPFLPEKVHGTDVVVLALCYIGDPEKGKKIIEPLRSFGTILGEYVGVGPFAGWQQAFDPLLTPGARNYWKSHNFIKLDDGLIASASEYAGKLPSNQCEIFFGALGGAINKVAKDATAYPHREANYVMNVHTRWDAAADDDKCIAWARAFYKATEKFATGGVYINFMTADEGERVKSGFGSSWDRLTKIKKQYDPNNLFRMNQNLAG